MVSTLGSFRQPEPVDYLGNRHVIDEMEQAGLTRLLLVTSLGCGDSWQYLPERARAAFGHEVRLKSLAESWLQSSALSWTILRPAGLQDGDATGQAELSQGKEMHGLVRVCTVEHIKCPCLVLITYIYFSMCDSAHTEGKQSVNMIGW